MLNNRGEAEMRGRCDAAMLNIRGDAEMRGRMRCAMLNIRGDAEMRGRDAMLRCLTFEEMQRCDAAMLNNRCLTNFRKREFYRRWSTVALLSIGIPC